jgi:hypothetical protein
VRIMRAQPQYPKAMIRTFLNKPLDVYEISPKRLSGQSAFSKAA